MQSVQDEEFYLKRDFDKNKLTKTRKIFLFLLVLDFLLLLENVCFLRSFFPDFLFLPQISWSIGSFSRGSLHRRKIRMIFYSGKIERYEKTMIESSYVIRGRRFFTQKEYEAGLRDVELDNKYCSQPDIK